MIKRCGTEDLPQCVEIAYERNNQQESNCAFCPKEKRGEGYGWALLNAVIDSTFNQHGGKTIDLVVDRMNRNARKMYYSCGFRLTVENEAFCVRV